jgi:hypothetical protein
LPPKHTGWHKANRHVILLLVLGAVFVQQNRAAVWQRIQFNPSSIGFGSTPVGSVQTRSAAIANVTDVEMIVSAASVTGTGFSLSGLNPSLSIAPGNSVTFSVRFAALASGTYSGNVAVTGHRNDESLRYRYDRQHEFEPSACSNPGAPA